MIDIIILSIAALCSIIVLRWLLKVAISIIGLIVAMACVGLLMGGCPQQPCHQCAYRGETTVNARILSIEGSTVAVSAIIQGQTINADLNLLNAELVNITNQTTVPIVIIHTHRSRSITGSKLAEAGDPLGFAYFLGHDGEDPSRLLLKFYLSNREVGQTVFRDPNYWRTK